MARSGPIIIIEDDYDDQEIIHDILKELEVPNNIIFFTNGSDGLKYLKTTNEQPFLIICDVNLPGINGLEFKKQIDNDSYLRQKSIPFVFLTTSASRDAVNKAFTEMIVQGFFEKSSSLSELKQMLKTIIEYWKISKNPNTA
ncbi:response regulator [Segetibacter koreensis]|uniref:response regulator n=1 Tax=Segetibacter koreensis TaxID=398037 RepID=UPI000380E345|nr:response regulator [Segetibacter koreensis]